MTGTDTFTLKSYSLTSPGTIDLYKKALDNVGCGSAYYSYELLLSNLGDSQQLHCFIMEASSGSVVVVMPFVLRKIVLNQTATEYKDVTSPWGYNGPFFKADLPDGLVMEFWQYVDAWYKEHNVVSEFLRFNFFGNYNGYSGTALHTLLNVKGAIGDWDNFWSNLKSNTRNQFRKAEKLGLQFKLHYQDITEDHIGDFYKVYICTMDRRDAIDSFYHPLEYFINFWRNNKGKCAIGLVYQDGLPISSELFLVSEKTMYSFLGGTDSNYFKLRPNEFLKINAVKWANAEGLQYYMIGGGLSNGPEDKLYQYKKKYFPLDDDIDFYTGRKIILEDAYLELMAKAGKQPVEKASLASAIEHGFFPKYREPN